MRSCAPSLAFIISCSLFFTLLFFLHQFCVKFVLPVLFLFLLPFIFLVLPPTPQVLLSPFLLICLSLSQIVFEPVLDKGRHVLNSSELGFQIKQLLVRGVHLKADAIKAQRRSWGINKRGGLGHRTDLLWANFHSQFCCKCLKLTL